VDVSEPASISSGIAARYAQAVFELAQDQGHLDKLEIDIQILKEALSQSVDLMSLINSPVYSREAQSKAVLAVAAKMKLTKTMSNTLGLMASKRRCGACASGSPQWADCRS
jgi:F-type H+-transporting ATPase subunit delta